MPKVKLNGTEIYYEEYGSKKSPAIVFSTPLHMDTSVYEPMVQAFSDEYRVIVYDHRGQGKSARPGKRADLQATTKDAIALIESLKLEPCHFVGNCLGAYVGLNLAVQRPDLLKSCTLMGATAEASSPQEIKDLDAYLDSVKREGAGSGAQSYANMCFGPSFRANTDPLVAERREKIMKHLTSLTPTELENIRQIFHHPSLTKEDLKRVSAPVLILAGDEDQPNNTAAYKRLGQWLPHVTYKTVQHAGYTLVVEQPQEVINFIRDHVEKAERSFSARAVGKGKEKEKRPRH